MSAFEIEKRIVGCSEEINRLWKKDGEKSRPEINRIKQRRDELRKQLSR